MTWKYIFYHRLTKECVSFPFSSEQIVFFHMKFFFEIIFIFNLILKVNTNRQKPLSCQGTKINSDSTLSEADMHRPF